MLLHVGINQWWAGNPDVGRLPDRIRGVAVGAGAITVC
jgi:hypothetical protein